MYFTEQDFKKIQNWLKLHSIKDTEFPKANFPISGYEKLAIVQDGENRILPLYNIISATGEGLHYEVLSLAEYESLENKSPNTVYFCVEEDETQGVIVSKMFLGITPIGGSATTDSTDVMVVNKSLYEVLGVQDSSTSTTDATSPALHIYNPITNTFQRTCTTAVEYGTRIIDSNSTLKVVFATGSARALKDDMLFLISEGDTLETVEIDTVSSASTATGYQYDSFQPKNSYYIGVNGNITLSMGSKGGETIETAIGEQTVTRTTKLNVVANNLLTANNTPYVLDGPEVVISKEDYPSQTLSCTLTFTPFKYMYIHRSASSYTLDSFGGTLGKQDFIQKKQETKGTWTINNNINDNLYYAILIPVSSSLGKMYTTFLGNDSTVTFKNLGTVSMQGATNAASTNYYVYTTEHPVAFADGTMTFIIN
jgi:hypothetical protein